MDWLIYIGLGALGGFVPVADWILFRRKEEKEDYNVWKTVRSIALGGLIGGLFGVAYDSYLLAFTNGIAGEAIGSLVLKLSQVGETVLKVFEKKK